MIVMVFVTCNFWRAFAKKKNNNNTHSGSIAGMQQRYSLCQVL